jgi:hypothetical protein
MGRRPYTYTLVIAVVLGHAYSMWATGATYWADSIDYVGFGEFFARGAPQQFYSGDRYFLLQHLMPGLPLLWAILSNLDERLVWYALALVQHGFAAVSLIAFALALRPFLGSLTVFVGALATSVHPFFSAFHNAFMTESIMSSCALLAAAQFVSCYAERNVTVTRASVLVASVVVGSMFRSYIVLLGVFLCMALFLFVGGCTYRLRAIVCMALIGMSVFLFPAYRYAISGKFFLPNVDFVELTVKSTALPSLTPQAETALLALPELSSVVSIEQLRTRPIAYEESIQISKRMLAEGQSEQDVRARLRSVASAMIGGQFLRELRFAGSSVGLLVVPFLGDPTAPAQSYLNVGDLQKHQEYYYQWFGWTQKDDYQATFDSFIRSNRQESNLYSAAAIDRYVAVLRPHISDSPISTKDPLRLAEIPPDLFVAGWLVCLLVMLFRAPAIAALFVFPVATVLIAVLTVPIGSIRYAHPLVPFYLIGTSYSIGWLADVSRRSVRHALRSRMRT